MTGGGGAEIKIYFIEDKRSEAEDDMTVCIQLRGSVMLSVFVPSSIIESRKRIFSLIDVLFIRVNLGGRMGNTSNTEHSQAKGKERQLTPNRWRCEGHTPRLHTTLHILQLL